MREALHPLDQFRAFQALRDEHVMGDEEMAARFFVTPAVVRQRLKLTTVSPKLLDLYAEDAMTLEHLMAFTVSTDHARQEAVWGRLCQSYSREPALRSPAGAAGGAPAELRLTRSGAAPVLLPEGADAKFGDAAALWNAAERAERRRDAQVARDLVIALPAGRIVAWDAEGGRVTLTQKALARRKRTDIAMSLVRISRIVGGDFTPWWAAISRDHGQCAA